MNSANLAGVARSGQGLFPVNLGEAPRVANDGDCAAGVSPGGAPQGTAPGDTPGAGTLSLVSIGNCCGNTQKEEPVSTKEHWEVRPCRCRSLWCSKCAPREGRRLQRRMADRVAAWSCTMLLTLTIDPSLFPDARTAYEWVRKHHGIGELIRRLYAGGYLRSRRYIAVLEFHASTSKNAGWPHWHVLVESAWVPIDVVRTVWGKLRPKPAGPAENANYPFGICDYRRKKFLDGRHAANYAAKYLTKIPAGGFPQWVFDFEGRIPRTVSTRAFGGMRLKQSRVEGRIVIVTHASAMSAWPIKSSQTRSIG